MENIETKEISEDLEYKRILLMYNAALRQLESKVNTINEEFKELHKYNPIEHITTRIKTKQSIINKLIKKGYTTEYQNWIKHVNDIAGMRIICSFKPDIYRMVQMFETLPDITILKRKDYIKRPKESGYSSYHLVVCVPVSLSVGTIDVKVEIQIRTMAMDFWASLEHKINYKYDKNLPKSIKKELKECAKMTTKLDNKMSNLGKNLIEDEKKLLTEKIKDEKNVYKALLENETRMAFIEKYS